ncbi:nucleolar protein 16 [Lepeophtheirus salmonis]|uniref:Nucleolar protein 16 n=2 Tax=Lepeophtheirus salmonis TaxID=72036 RepID=D3PGX0_LEPSM|nr:nucleolar protein 16-like [Lepeophtheirus salmonis]XP_040583450.1 nucleolar protein 16-like [Lepeophtheirus salmonis]ADD24516.1 Nucleolar protein 16 [Lepeophtheirus salmonis]
MPKLRKTQRRQKYKFDMNRRRVNAKLNKHQKGRLKMHNPTIKEHWDNSIAFTENIDNLGIVMKPNKAFPVISAKDALLKKKPKRSKKSSRGPKGAVTSLQEQMEKEMKECSKSHYRFSEDQLKFITHMLDKHGDDYEAMATDPMNHYQETANKIRRKIQNFIESPTYFAPYAKERGLI